MQPDLFPHAGLEVKPETGRTAPRLWIRRLVIWSEPGKPPLREIPLRPGLNIIWSPDPADQAGAANDSALGHGSGKTLFCRLLRYCLGEDRFTSEGQRFRVAQAFPDGMVGAEVVVDGVTWAVVRPIGNRRQHFAIPNADLNQVIAGAYAASGMEPFLQAIETVLLSEDVSALIPGTQPFHAWLVALAWLSRDQECRFDKVLDWRSSDSDSGSPARGLSAPKLLDALRALIGAIVPDEYRLRAEIDTLDSQKQEDAQDSARRQWEAERLRSRIAQDIGLSVDDLPAGRLAVDPLRKAAKVGLAQVAVVGPEVDVTHLEVLRNEAQEAARHVVALEKKLIEVETRIEEIEGAMPHLTSDLSRASYDKHQTANPVCHICDVPIDRALAEGCKLSHKLPNLDEAKRRYEKLQQELEQEKDRLRTSYENRDEIAEQLVPAQARAEELLRRSQIAEKARAARSEAWYKTRRLIDDADRLDELLVAQEQTQRRVESLGGEIEAKRALTGSFRDSKAGVFNRLSIFFDAIIREFVGPASAGKIALDGNGLKLSVELGGERSTAAIDSLKVIAFDLAVMCMSIEGGTRLPAFLVHDSPREADLGLSVYHRLFHLVRNLERGDGQPRFQYIVTTTTRPPHEVSDKPWLQDKLGGAPAEARLLRRDL